MLHITRASEALIIAVHRGFAMLLVSQRDASRSLAKRYSPSPLSTGAKGRRLISSLLQDLDLIEPEALADFFCELKGGRDRLAPQAQMRTRFHRSDFNAMIAY